jgi:hypothetical protein
VNIADSMKHGLKHYNRKDKAMKDKVYISINNQHCEVINWNDLFYMLDENKYKSIKDTQFWKHTYVIGVEYSSFLVNADNEQEAFDALIDYCKDNAPGLIMTGEGEEYLDDYIQGGNEGLYLSSYNVSVQAIN